MTAMHTPVKYAAEGVELYMQLLDRGIELVFLKEPHINTATYKQALSKSVPMTLI